MLALGGAAMVLVGAGLMLSHPMVKKYVGQLGAERSGPGCRARHRALSEAQGDVTAARAALRYARSRSSPCPRG